MSQSYNPTSTLNANIGGTTLGADNCLNIFCGWVRKTSTNGHLFGWQSGIGIYMSSNSLRITTNNTTDGVWGTDTSDVFWLFDWSFVAVALSCENTSVPGAVRVWACRLGETQKEYRPTEKAVTNTTARSGNYTGAATLHFGADTSGVSGFGGEIGWMMALTNLANTTSDSMIQLGSSGVITDDEARVIYERIVEPAFFGRYDSLIKRVKGNTTNSHAFVDMDVALPMVELDNSSNSQIYPTVTRTNLLMAETRAPYPFRRGMVDRRNMSMARR